MSEADLTLSRKTIFGGAVVLVAAGAGAAYLLLAPLRESSIQADAAHADGAASASATAAERAPAPDTPAPQEGATRAAAVSEVVVTLSREAVERAGISTAAVTRGARSAELRLPGVVEPSTYRQVAVTPLTAGRVTRVLVELGQHVRRGQTMAEIFSPELAEAQARYAAAQAGLDAHEREFRRTEELVKIGAASRQDLERIHAEHVARTADVQSARSRLELLGVETTTLDAAAGQNVGTSVDVPAPIDGVVTERRANVGLNVDTGSDLFTVIDLSTVWVVADLYERDFPRVRVGSSVRVTTTAYPGLTLQGRVDYIDPQVNRESRTAKLRVEVGNRQGQLRLGMYADVHIAPPAEEMMLLVPRQAVQAIGGRQVVYLADPQAPGRFTERPVATGPVTGDAIEILTGLEPGDVVVAAGSFAVRAERERTGSHQH
jgi:RND family efflux transporter MFP subunit